MDDIPFDTPEEAARFAERLTNAILKLKHAKEDGHGAALTGDEAVALLDALTVLKLRAPGLDSDDAQR